MKIAYLIAGTFNPGGMERVLANKTRWLAEHGYEVMVVTTDQCGRIPFFPLHPSINCFDLGINYDENNGGSFVNKLVSFPLKQWRHRKRLEKLLLTEMPDITVCMFNNDVSFAYSLRDGSHKVLEAHFSKYKKLQYARHGLWRLADRWRMKREEEWVKHYERFVVLTHEDSDLWGKLPNMVVIPNARTFEADEVSDLSQKKVLAVGRLNEQKGFDRLLKIWRQIENRPDGWMLEIVGNGPLKEVLLHQIQALGIGDSVKLSGAVKDIKAKYLSSSVVVMTSRYEGLPMALLEAQAFGIPVVSYACKCGPRDLILDGGNGFLVEEDDPKDFARKLSMLMQREELRRRLGAENRLMSRQYAEPAVMNQWHNLFQSLENK